MPIRGLPSLGGLRRSMSSKRSPPAPRSSRGSPGRNREIDALESLGEAFEEACEHAARAQEFPSAQLGPLEELPISSLWPGEFGWQRTVALDSGRSTGILLWFLLPGIESESRGSPDPVPGKDPSSYAFLEVLSGPPWRILAASASTAAGSASLKAFATAVARELRSE